MTTFNRRNFLRASGLTVLPALIPSFPSIARMNPRSADQAGVQPINFTYDGEFLDPPSYINKLLKINSSQPIGQDYYGVGGAVADLEKKFAEITGKEKAVYMPTGTMANQLAIHVLCEENTKVFVQETSHVYRDEADAAQSIHNKRLIPLAKGEPGFTLEELQESIDYHTRGEVFRSGIGTISIENPVRRNDGRQVPIKEISKISAFCKQNNYKLHLDGARLYMASVWSGIPVAEYARYFDTVYISLYKYLGAAAGAILCGDKIVIDKMEHLIKIYGGTMFGNWANAAMALYNLQGLEERLKNAKRKGEELFVLLNQLPEMKVTSINDGTNIYNLQLSSGISGSKLGSVLAKEHTINVGRSNKDGLIKFFVNETILYRDTQNIFNAIKDASRSAKT